MTDKNLLRILFIEDVPSDVDLGVLELRKEKLKFEHTTVCTRGDLLKAFKKFKPNLIISDYMMPTYNGLQALRDVKEIDKSMPFILFTGTVNEETAVECLKAGATDYVLKEHLLRLPFAVKEALEQTRIQIEKSAADLLLKENEEKLQSIFRAAPVGIGLVVGRIFIEVNDTFCRMTGYNRSELIGKDAETIYEKDEQNESAGIVIYRHIAEKGTGSVETRFKCKDGRVLNIFLSSTPLDKDDLSKGVTFIAMDITERKEKELELILAKEQAEESDRLKSAFLTNMSHEIRTPMNGILGFTELLREPNLTSDEQQDFIQTIQISGARMLYTINNIVDVSKIESGLMKVDIKETNINEKIEFTYKFFKPEVEMKGLQFLFKNSLPAKEAIINTDNEKVYAILTNLVKNAIKFTNKGSIEFGYEKKGEYLEFYVKDTGVGIPKNQKELIFERFRQGSESHNRGYEGSGLGLSICKSYVEMLGGEIWVESEEGKGSTFYFTIPYNAVSEENIEIINAGSAENKGVQLKKLKILVVEDDEISHSLLTRMLRNISKEVLHAITGVEAIEACRNNPDLDLVLMDIRMPKMDGNEATRQIRLFNKNVIIIAQTAYAFTGDSEKALEAGCNNYISKPINKTSLYELIKKHVNK